MIFGRGSTPIKSCFCFQAAREEIQTSTPAIKATTFPSPPCSSPSSGSSTLHETANEALKANCASLVVHWQLPPHRRCFCVCVNINLALPLFLSLLGNWSCMRIERQQNELQVIERRAKTREQAKDGAIWGERNKAKICMLEKKCRPCRQNAPHAEWAGGGGSNGKGDEGTISLKRERTTNECAATLVQVSELERELLFFDCNSSLGGGSTFTSPSPTLSPRKRERERRGTRGARWLCSCIQFEFPWCWWFERQFFRRVLICLLRCCCLNWKGKMWNAEKHQKQMHFHS